MKFIVFNGSPAGNNSHTHIISQAFLNGAKQAGAEIENINLINQNIQHCHGCFHCWFQSPGQCIMKDDMAELLTKYKSADVVCFATPVYTWNMTAALKNFVDRLAPLKSPTIIQKQDDFDLNNAKMREQKFVVIANCGFPGNNNFETMKAVFASCQPVLEIYRNCGHLLKTQDEKIKIKVNEYLNIVSQAGYELASHGYVLEQTKSQLDVQLMSITDYIQYIGM